MVAVLPEKKSLNRYSIERYNKQFTMARYTGPKTRIARKFGEPIFGPDKNLDRKNFPPGQHGMNKKRKKPLNMAFSSGRSRRLNIPTECLSASSVILLKKHQEVKGVTGEVLLQMLESRLDNVVYRLGIAPPRQQPASSYHTGILLLTAKS
jgi:small subunit ribosomal protein S4